MPFAQVQSSFGSLALNYTISTPTTSNAEAIDPNLPTLLFIHPVYVGQHIWHSQFGDPHIRRFNLVALELRSHGETGGDVPEGYGQEDAAEEVASFMDALNLPPCHIVGISMGTIIALQLAVSYSKKVISLFLVSCLGLKEPVAVGEGRQEIYDCWTLGMQNGEELAILDALHGAVQLSFNNEKSSLINAVSSLTMGFARKNWTIQDLDSYYRITVKFFVDRKELSTESLSALTVRIKMIHCMADIAYTEDFSEKYFKKLEAAGLKVSLDKIEGAPHFGALTHGTQINPILHDFIMSHTSTPLPAPPTIVTSPFEEGLVKYGLKLNEEDSD